VLKDVIHFIQVLNADKSTFSDSGGMQHAENQSLTRLADAYDTHTHPFNGPLSRTARVSRHQKGKTNLDFNEARDSQWQWHQLDQSAPRSRQITMPAPHLSVFYRPDALPAAQPTASKH